MNRPPLFFTLSKTAISLACDWLPGSFHERFLGEQERSRKGAVWGTSVPAMTCLESPGARDSPANLPTASRTRRTISQTQAGLS